MKSTTTRWGLIAGIALAFVLFEPDLIRQIPYAGGVLLALAKFAAAGGLAKIGIEAPDKTTGA